MPFGSPICSCCGSSENIHAHHLFLKSEGCPDSLTVWLCGGCHRRAHFMKRNIAPVKWDNKAMTKYRDNINKYRNGIAKYQHKIDSLTIQLEKYKRRIVKLTTQQPKPINPSPRKYQPRITEEEAMEWVKECFRNIS